MRVLTVVHQADAGPGVFADSLLEAGASVTEWRPAEDPAPASHTAYDAAIVLGGAMNVDEEVRHPWLVAEKRLLRDLLDAETPVLGVCLGAQLLAEAAGGRAHPAARPEIGWHDVELAEPGTGDALIGDLPPRFCAFEWHSYEIELPPGATALAASSSCLQAFRCGSAAWGLQFHAEVTREIVGGWIDKEGPGGEFRREGIDPGEARAETETRIGAWNELGLRVCDRFLALARDGR